MRCLLEKIILSMNFAFFQGVFATKISIQCVKLKKTDNYSLFSYVLLMKHIGCMYEVLFYYYHREQLPEMSITVSLDDQQHCSRFK